MRPPSLTRCIHSRPCPTHTRRWDIALLPLALIWAIRPWWPHRRCPDRLRGRIRYATPTPRRCTLPRHHTTWHTDGTGYTWDNTHWRYTTPGSTP